MKVTHKLQDSAKCENSSFQIKSDHNRCLCLNGSICYLLPIRQTNNEQNAETH